MENKHTPTALILSRQNLPTIDRSTYAPAENLHKGAYILSDFGDGSPQVILMASGSEVGLALQSAAVLADEGIRTRVVSFPSWDLFEKQPDSYQAEVFPQDIKVRVAVEAGVSMGWRKWIGDQGDVVTVDKYGASAPASTIFSEYGFSVENIVTKVKNLLG